MTNGNGWNRNLFHNFFWDKKMAANGGVAGKIMLLIHKVSFTNT